MRRGAVDPFSPGMLAQKGSLFLTRPTLFHYIASREELEQSAAELFDLVASGKVKIEVGQTLRARRTPPRRIARWRRGRRPDRPS